ncbi:hypothetical protein R3W88_019674 [Solanum pinnatisectum]|uniref:Uncharacterized protein n=1 Tax=Solanum pinnatisectum TaxID=50273 RepID=A0AAV9KK62_9SOLN|nr:hypothetical protein R3W88_019674 [Solanum pinnatisectum]
MANPLVTYSDDETSSASTALPSTPASPEVHFQGKEKLSTDTSLTSLPNDPSPSRPPPPLPVFASGDPFTPSPSPPSSKIPNPIPTSPVMLDFESEVISVKNMVKLLEIGKEKYFRTKPVLRGRTFHSEILHIDTGWGDLFLDSNLLVYEKEVVDFYTNLTFLEGNVATSTVNGVELVFDHIRLGKILNIPTNGLAEYGIIPKGHRWHEACFCDIGIVHALENKEPIDWPSFMIKHMVRIEFVVPLGEGRALTHADMFTGSSLAECGLLVEPDQVPIAFPRALDPLLVYFLILGLPGTSLLCFRLKIHLYALIYLHLKGSCQVARTVSPTTTR